MRIAATSDLHGHFPEVPDCDVCVIAGDMVAATTREDEARQWKAFGHWLVALVTRGITPIGVAGNHDFLLQNHPEWAQRFPWVYLQDSGATFKGVNFWGTPWQPYFGGWAFNAPETDPGEEFLREKFAKIPTGTDVLISHGPPVGFHDRVGRQHVGSVALNTRIQQVMPRLAVYGHIHHGFGVEHVEGVTLANVSYTDVKAGRYVPANEPVIFDL